MLNTGVGACGIACKPLAFESCSTHLYKGILWVAAAALVAAIDTARILFAPRCDLFSVPSSWISLLSIPCWSVGSIPAIWRDGPITWLILLTAFNTPLPRYLFSSLSRSSSASCVPVDAPDGTDETPTTPLSSWHAASMVGAPLESNISRAQTFWIFGIDLFHIHNSTLNLLFLVRFLRLPHALFLWRQD